MHFLFVADALLNVNIQFVIEIFGFYRMTKAIKMKVRSA